MKDLNEKNNHFNVYYKSVNELAEKIFIEAFSHRQIIVEREWERAVEMATFIYFHYNVVIDSVNKYLYKTNHDVKDDNKFLEENLTKLKNELEEYKDKKDTNEDQ